jgi:hypothetical protein
MRLISFGQDVGLRQKKVGRNNAANRPITSRKFEKKC